MNIHYGRGEIPVNTNDQKASRKNPNKFQEWKGKWANLQSKLYLIIHEISSGIFWNYEAQECLSILASCESITIIASSSLLNANLLWDSLLFSRFAWRFIEVNTFQHSKLPFDHPFIRNIVTGPGGIIMKENTGENLIPVLRSFGKGHIEFLQRIGDAYFKSKQKTETTAKYFRNGHIMFPFQEALEIALNSLIVKKKADLTALIKELIDHRILLHVLDEKKGGEYLKFLISEIDFKDYVMKFNFQV